MGNCLKNDDTSKLQEIRNNEIESTLDNERKGTVIKLLLLGPGECGKSTILKQMKILHDNGYTDLEMLQAKAIIYSNILNSMALLLDYMPRIGIVLHNAELKKDAHNVIDAIIRGEECERFSEVLYQSLKRLWSDKQVQRTYNKRHQINIPENTKYFLDKLERIYRIDYLPSYQDILHVRIPTYWVSEISFMVNKIKYRVLDVGGQKSERRKWIHLFDDVNAVIFIAAINEYDQLIEIDGESHNRLYDSMKLFDQICNNQWFINTNMILFLNKIDLFAEKIIISELQICFKQYTGENNYNDAITYIKKRFNNLNRNTNKEIFTHETCATDTSQVQAVITNVIDTVRGFNMKISGVL